MPSDAKPMVVDAHQHFWDLGRFRYSWMTDDMTALRRNYLPSDLRPLLDRCGVDGTVFVQAQHSVEETRWALNLARDNPWIVGVVGWADLRSPQLERQIVPLLDQPKLVGLRHIVHDEPDQRWLLQDDVVRGLNLLVQHRLTYDLLLRPQHLNHIPELIRRVPGLPMVIDHLAKPLIRKRDMEPWRSELAAVAAHAQIYCKISGMITEADQRNWRAADLAPFVETVLELFGPSRLMFGSDWPVCNLAGQYSEVLAAAERCLSALSPSERAAVFGGNAIRFYNLAV